MPAQKDSEPSADCYSAGEREAMEWFQKLRGWLLGPLLTLLDRWGTTQNHVTLLSTLVGLSFCPLYFWSKPAAFIAIGLHVILDGIDGSLARHLGVESRKGSLTDSMADMVVVVGTTVTLMATPQHVIGVYAGGLYIFLYTMVMVFAMVRNALRIPFSWVVRPRFFVYGWFIVETYFWHGTIDYVVWGFNLLLAIETLTGFFKIRRKV